MDFFGELAVGLTVKLFFWTFYFKAFFQIEMQIS